MNNTLPELRIYISFIADDLKFAQPCAKLIQNAIKVTLNTDYHTTFYSPENIPVGENTSDTLEEHINESDIAIILVSHSYLIEKNEALRVYTKHPHPIIIQLEPINHGASFTPFDRSDVVVEHSFIQAQDSGRTTEIEFSNQVATIIQRTLTERESHHPSPLPTLSPQEIAEQLIAIPLSEFTVKTIPSRATRGFGAAANADNGNNNDVSAPVRDIVEELVRWSHTPSSDQPRLCALLGDVGTGKTTTSILVARNLLELRKKGEPVPFPLYFDLRKISPNGLYDFGLHILLTKFLAGYTRQFTSANEILEIIHSENTLIIFDGLDELLVHLSLSDGQRLTRSLLDALNLSDSDSNSGNKAPRTRLLLSCRTQYFRNLEDEVRFFDHDGAHHNGDNITLILTLLPFDEDQIQEYLRRNVPDSDPNRLLDMIRSVHDLGALASQPVLLNMIRDILPAIEADSHGDRRVRSVDIYKRFVDGWLRRDMGKHSFTPEHKIQLMTHLAWQVWRSGVRTWNAEQMDDWLLEFCDEHKNIQRRSRDHTSDQLTQDFRTATFLMRRGDNLTFIHSSFLEYFLAVRLRDSLFDQAEEDARTTWDITRPSNETFTFFAELIDSLENDVRSHAIAQLEYVGKHASVTARENIFAYTLRAISQGMPHPHPDALVLSDTDLRGWNIGSKQTHLNLSGVPLRGTRLDDAHIINTNLDRTDATGASMQRALFEHCTLTNATFSDADLAGTVFRHCDMEGASLAKAKRHRTQLLYTIGNHEILKGVLTAPINKAEAIDTLPITHIFGGHGDMVTAVAWSPDGGHILTGSDDGTARVWDTSTWENALTLDHGVCWFNAVVWSPDGTQILTSTDTYVYVWDTTTWTKTHTLEHSDLVQSVVWSPDGTRILTGAYDNTARIWDAKTGTLLTPTLTHNEAVTSVGWSPDGTRILTSEDTHVYVWNTTTWTKTHTLKHSDLVQSVVWSPDGTRILTASADYATHFWETNTWKNVHTFSRSLSDCAITWSPDSTHILTGSDENTAYIWNTLTWDITHSLAQKGSVTTATWSPTGTHILTTSEKTARIWEATTGKLVCARTYADFISTASWSPNGRQILFGCSFDSMHVWDIDSDEECLSLRSMLYGTAAWSPDSRRIVAAHNDYTARIWDTQTQCNCLEIPLSTRRANIAWTADGQHILTQRNNGAVQVWDVYTGNEKPTSHDLIFPSAEGWSLNGDNLLISCFDGTHQIWNIRTGNFVCMLDDTDRASSVSWSPDGRYVLAKPFSGEALIFDVIKGETIFRLPFISLFSKASWSPDSTRIIGSGHGNTLRIWDIRYKRDTLTFEPEKPVHEVSWSPDGKHILTTSYYGDVQIWDAETGEPALFMIATLPKGECAVLSSDQTQVIGASPYAWRWLGRYAKHSDGSIERVPVEINGPLPPLSHDADAASRIEG